MATDTEYRIQYFSPEIVRGDCRDDFALYYYEGGKELSFPGRLPRGDSSGTLDFPSQYSWSFKVPGWAREKRSIIESRILEYASCDSSLSWLIPAKFGPRPGLQSLPTQVEARKNVARVRAAQSEYEGVLKQITATQRVGNLMLKVTLAVAVLFVVVKIVLVQG